MLFRSPSFTLSLGRARFDRLENERETGEPKWPPWIPLAACCSELLSLCVRSRKHLPNPLQIGWLLSVSERSDIWKALPSGSKQSASSSGLFVIFISLLSSTATNLLPRLCHSLCAHRLAPLSLSLSLSLYVSLSLSLPDRKSTRLNSSH